MPITSNHSKAQKRALPSDNEKRSGKEHKRSEVIKRTEKEVRKCFLDREYLESCNFGLYVLCASSGKKKKYGVPFVARNDSMALDVVKRSGVPVDVYQIGNYSFATGKVVPCGSRLILDK